LLNKSRPLLTCPPYIGTEDMLELRYVRIFLTKEFYLYRCSNKWRQVNLTLNFPYAINFFFKKLIEIAKDDFTGIEGEKNR